MRAKAKATATTTAKAKAEPESVAEAESGFTVIELMIAFTILAIVAGSLFQVFYVSARNNDRAREYDAANNLSITVAELFKANPELDGEPMFENEPGAAVGYTWRSADGKRLVKYYGGYWNELPLTFQTSAAAAVSASAASSAVVPDGAKYVLEAALGEIVDDSPNPNYMAGAARVGLDSTQEYRLVVNDTPDGIEVLFNGVPQEVEQGRVGGVIPVSVDYDASGVLPKHIAVVNRTDRTVNVNLFGVPSADVSSAEMASSTAAKVSSAELSSAELTSADVSSAEMADSPASRREYIEVTPVEGALGVMFLDELTGDSVTKTIAVSVRTLPDGGKNSGGVNSSGGSGGNSNGSGGGVELARVEAGKYVPG